MAFPCPCPCPCSGLSAPGAFVCFGVPVIPACPALPPPQRNFLRTCSVAVAVAPLLHTTERHCPSCSPCWAASPRSCPARVPALASRRASSSPTATARCCSLTTRSAPRPRRCCTRCAAARSNWPWLTAADAATHQSRRPAAWVPKRACVSALVPGQSCRFCRLRPMQAQPWRAGGAFDGPRARGAVDRDGARRAPRPPARQPGRLHQRLLRVHRGRRGSCLHLPVRHTEGSNPSLADAAGRPQAVAERLLRWWRAAPEAAGCGLVAYVGGALPSYHPLGGGLRPRRLRRRRADAPPTPEPSPSPDPYPNPGPNPNPTPYPYPDRNHNPDPGPKQARRCTCLARGRRVRRCWWRRWGRSVTARRAPCRRCLLLVAVVVAVVDSRVGAGAEGRVGGVPTYPNQNPQPNPTLTARLQPYASRLQP
eukprot:scaffold8855_cov57-Phaeocystis_antarctica.AAC.2